MIVESAAAGYCSNVLVVCDFDIFEDVVWWMADEVVEYVEELKMVG